MSNQLPGGGGVKSLRAMFESSHPERSASPEARGRSPPDSTRSNESNSRPTSRVRASFIAVEPFDPIAKMAENGYQDPAVESPSVASSTSNPFKGLADDGAPAPSTTAQRRGSMSLDPQRDSEVLEDVRQTVTEEAQQRRASVDVKETVPETAILTGPTNTPLPEKKEEEAMGDLINNEENKLQDKKLSDAAGPKIEATRENVENAVKEAAEGLKKVELAATEKNEEAAAPSADAPTPAPPVNTTKQEPASVTQEPAMGQPDKIVSSVEDETAMLKPADPTEESVVSGGQGLPAPVEPLQPLSASAPKPAEETSEPAVEEKIEAQPEPEEKANGTSEPAEAPELEKPAENIKASGTKSPLPPKTPPSAIASPKSTTSKTSAKEPAKRTSRASLKSAASSSAPKPRASSRPAGEKKKDITHSSPGFVKPRPKSPTRPAKLPSHLTAPTAASAAKRDAEKAEEKKPAATRPKTTTPRAPAVASKTTTAAASKTAADAKKPSSRTSLPAQSTTKRPESRTSRPSVGAKAPDDGFLARMMRPTASSASKTHDKKDETVKSPPRRTPSVKPKQANGAAAKVQKKVVEGVDKAKEKVLGHDDAEKAEEHQEDASAPKLEPAAPITEKPAEEQAEEGKAEERESTPQEETPSGETMTQTPAGIEGGVIRSPGHSQTTRPQPQATTSNPVTSSPTQLQRQQQPQQPQPLQPFFDGGGARALRSVSTSSVMTTASWTTSTTSATNSTAPSSVTSSATPTPPASVIAATTSPSEKRRSRISNLVAFFENK